MSTDRDSGLLGGGLTELGLELDAVAQVKLLELLRLVYVWNRSAGLTTIDPGDAVRLHLLDSLLALPLLFGSTAVDLGSGGGFPGLPLAIARPDLAWLLVESNRRRCSFLLEAVRVLALPNVRVHEGDATKPVEQFDTVISRAFRHPPEFLSLANGWLRRGGRVVLMTVAETDQGLRAIGTDAGLAVEDVRRAVLPGGVEPRVVGTYRLNAECGA